MWLSNNHTQRTLKEEKEKEMKTVLRTNRLRWKVNEKISVGEGEGLSSILSLKKWITGDRQGIFYIFSLTFLVLLSRKHV